MTTGSILILDNANAAVNNTLSIASANTLKFATGITTFTVGGLSGAGDSP